MIGNGFLNRWSTFAAGFHPFKVGGQIWDKNIRLLKNNNYCFKISLPSVSCFNFELSLDLCTHTQCTLLGIWKKQIPVTVNRVPRCLEQVELTPTEYGREGNIHLRVSERHAQAASRAPSEAHHVARQITAVGRFGFIEPSLRSEREAVREQLFVMGNREVGHGDHGTGGKNIWLVHDCFCLRDAGCALGGTVG